MIIEAEAPLSKTTDSDGASSATLTKIKLIEEVSRVLEIPRKEAAVIVERILNNIVPSSSSQLVIVHLIHTREYAMREP